MLLLKPAALNARYVDAFTADAYHSWTTISTAYKPQGPHSRFGLLSRRRVTLDPCFRKILPTTLELVAVSTHVDAEVLFMYAILRSSDGGYLDT